MESFNPNAVDVNKRLPPQKKFDPNKRIQSIPEGPRDPETARKVLESMQERGANRPADIGPHPEPEIGEPVRIIPPEQNIFADRKRNDEGLLAAVRGLLKKF